MATEGSGPGPFRVEEDGDQFFVVDETTGRKSAPFPNREDAEWWITTQPTPVKAPGPPAAPAAKADTANAAAPEPKPGLR